MAGMAFFVRSMQPARVFKHAGDMAAWVRPLVRAEEPDFEAKLLASIDELRRAIKTP